MRPFAARSNACAAGFRRRPNPAGRKTVQVFERHVSCVSPGRVEASLECVRHFVATRDGTDDISFWRAICALQSPEVTVAPPDDHPLLVWDRHDAAGVASALRDAMAVEDLRSGCGYSDAERRLNQPVMREGLRHFRRSFPASFPVFCKAVPFVVLAKRDGHVSGSVSSRIGFVWLAPSPSWSGRDCGEHLWHEYIHQCLFLEDMVNTLFVRDPSALSEPWNRVPSAVRGVARRYDLAYHSAFVAAGLVEYRARNCDIDGARSMFPGLWSCLDGLAARKDVLTENGADQLDRLIGAVFRQAEHLAALDPPALTRP